MHPRSQPDYAWLPLAATLAERDDYIGVPTWFGWELGWQHEGMRSRTPSSAHPALTAGHGPCFLAPFG
ncbi:hypothetical protein [Kitasatospora cinereorecta]|uniref:Uncharacterized protein n=1 Tax=Kitasatospora cinereorecta TaxID=285560 RepID=A0ABW0VSP5_9ACTN